MTGHSLFFQGTFQMEEPLPFHCQDSELKGLKELPKAWDGGTEGRGQGARGSLG